MDLNKVMIIGRLTRAPEAKSLANGTNVSTFAIATNFAWKDASGQKQDRSEFHNIVAWRKLAEICNQYLKKGSKVYLEGRLQTRNWTDQNGVTKYRTEIIAENMIMLDSAGTSGNAAPAPGSLPNAIASQMTNPNSHDEEIKIEDIPFA